MEVRGSGGIVPPCTELVGALGTKPQRLQDSANARSMTKAPGVLVLPSLRPRSSQMRLRSLSISGEPQIMTRSVSGLSGGMPKSENNLPFSMRSVTRPWFL